MIVAIICRQYPLTNQIQFFIIPCNAHTTEQTSTSLSNKSTNYSIPSSIKSILSPTSKYPNPPMLFKKEKKKKPKNNTYLNTRTPSLPPPLKPKAKLQNCAFHHPVSNPIYVLKTANEGGYRFLAGQL